MLSKTCFTTDSLEDISLAKFSGLIETSALYFFAISNTSLLSLLTIVLLMYFEFTLASIVQAIKGFQAKSIMFFLEIPLDPPRPGITDSTLLVICSVFINSVPQPPFLINFFPKMRASMFIDCFPKFIFSSIYII